MAGAERSGVAESGQDLRVRQRRKLAGAALDVYRLTMEIFSARKYLWENVGDGRMSSPGSGQPDCGAERETMGYSAELKRYKQFHPPPRLADAMRAAAELYHVQNDQPSDYREGEEPPDDLMYDAERDTWWYV